MKVLTEEAITHLREAFIQEHDIYAFNVFINTLDDYERKLHDDVVATIKAFSGVL